MGLRFLQVKLGLLVSMYSYVDLAVPEKLCIIQNIVLGKNK